MGINMSRRSFTQAMAATGVVAPSILTTVAVAEEDRTGEISETLECDVVVVGAGMSGLAAAVQAAELGATVICLESSGVVGGMAGGVEGIFAVNSKLAQEQGINVSVGELIRIELEQNQYRNSSLGLHDMVKNSGDDIDWLVEQGCRFGTIDNYVGFHPIFHWFETLTGQESYIVPMDTKARELGVEFVLESHADSLLTDAEGGVCGVVASKPDGTNIQVNAKAVIMATGGYAMRMDYLSELGYNETNTIPSSMGGDGSGHDACIAVGGASNRANTGILGAGTIPEMPPFFMGGYFCSVMNSLGAKPDVVWIDENGDRYCNEDCSLANHMITGNPVRQHKKTYILLDDAMMTAYINGDEQGMKELADGQELGVMFQAEGWAALAETLGCDPERLVATINQYNVYCDEGMDEDFGKDPQYMAPLSTDGTVWAVEMRCEIGKTMGAVKTNRDFSVVTPAEEAIPGLYMVGVEGAMIWANVYTMNISGSCAANNVYSGRTAAKHAVATRL